MNNKLKFALLSTVIVITLLLSACGGGSGSEEAVVETPTNPATEFDCALTHYEVVNAVTVRDPKCQPNDTFTAYINDDFVRGYVRLNHQPWVYEGETTQLITDIDIITEDNDKLQGTTCSQLVNGSRSKPGTEWTVTPQNADEEFEAICTSTMGWSVIATTQIGVKSQTANVAPLPQAPYVTWVNQVNGELYLQCVAQAQPGWYVWKYPSTVDIAALETGTHSDFGEAIVINNEYVTCIPVLMLNKDKFRVEYENMVYTLDRRIVQGGYEWVSLDEMHPGWNYYVCEGGNVAYYNEPNFTNSSEVLLENCIHGTYRKTENNVSYFAVEGTNIALVHVTGAFPSPQQ